MEKNYQSEINTSKKRIKSLNQKKKQDKLSTDREILYHKKRIISYREYINSYKSKEK